LLCHVLVLVSTRSPSSSHKGPLKCCQPSLSPNAQHTQFVPFQ
jgi:hypothetical protein